MKCPICNKEGIPDYNTEPTICPQCNTDLKGFLIIEEASHAKNRNILFYKWISSIAVALFLISIFVFLSYQKPHPTTYPVKERVVFHNEKDSIKENYFKYVVKKGDNLHRIANLFYNDYSQYKLIMEMNHLSYNSIIYPSDTLIIKIQ